MHQKRVMTLFLAVLLVGCFVAPGFASQPGDQSDDGLETSSAALMQLSAQARPLSNGEMEEITGEFMGQTIAGTLIAYAGTQVLDYYGADEWLQETAIPAVESAVVSAYETTKDVLSSSFEMIGESLLEYPYAWNW